VLLPAQKRKDILVSLLVLGDLASHQCAPRVFRHGEQLGILSLFLFDHEVAPVRRVPLEPGVGRAIVVIVYHHLGIDLTCAVVARCRYGKLVQNVNRAIDLGCIRLLAVSNRCSLGNPIGLAELAALERIIQNESLRTHNDTAGNEHFNSENEVRCVLTGIQSLDHIPSYYPLA